VVSDLNKLSFHRTLAVVAIDLGCFFIAAVVGWRASAPAYPGHLYALATAGAAGLALLALSYCGAYSSDALRSPRRTAEALLLSMGVAFVATLVVYFVLPVLPGARRGLAYAAMTYFPLMLSGRTLVRWRAHRFPERILIVGTTELSVAIAKDLRELPRFGIELVGFLTADDDRRGDLLAGFPILGNTGELEKLVPLLKITRIVVVAEPHDPLPDDALLAAKLEGCRVDRGAEFYEQLTGQMYVVDSMLRNLVFAEGFRISQHQRRTKRAFDVAVAAGGLLVAAPLLALAVLAIRLDSKGSAFYLQVRVGLGGNEFRLIKLRSMELGAEEDTGATLTTPDDPRITRVGRLLRPTRIDEIPQLWNVLKGEMSLVGPRPERPELLGELVERYPLFRWRSSIQPGITGWAQVRHGYVNDMPGFAQKLALDLYYMKYRSFALDLAILWHTIKTVVLLRGI
jgi:exopolysaccharide biosynthesis polyprenyl glycosylphosphotransferase